VPKTMERTEGFKNLSILGWKLMDDNFCSWICPIRTSRSEKLGTKPIGIFQLSGGDQHGTTDVRAINLFEYVASFANEVTRFCLE
jgi:hypothetical protein